MDVTLLGTMGWMPRGARETTCFAVRSGSSLLLFDAGTGLRRLLDPEHAGLLDGAEEVHLFLSHYHLDHVCGLAYLSGVLAGHDVVIHPPAEALTGVDPLAAVAGLVRRPYNPVDLADMKRVRVQPGAGGENEVAGHVVRLRPQHHTRHQRVVPAGRRARHRHRHVPGPGRGARSPRAPASGSTRRGTGPATRRSPRCRGAAPRLRRAQRGDGRRRPRRAGRRRPSDPRPPQPARRRKLVPADARRGASGVRAHRRRGGRDGGAHIGSRLTHPPAPREDASVARA